MMSLSIAPLTKAGFAPFGEVVESVNVKPKLINEGFAERFDDLANIDVARNHDAVNRRSNGCVAEINLCET